MGTLLADGGLGATLIRRPDPPTDDELRGLLGMQLLAAGAVAAVATAVGAGTGTVGRVVAVMAWALPLSALQVPTRILLERSLSYGRIVRADVAGTLTYALLSVAVVVAGLGVVAVAAAALVGSALTTLVMVLGTPVRLVSPALRWSAVRPLLGFGLRVQGVSAVNLARDQGVNVSVAALAGVGTLGLWSLAYKVMQIPFLLFEALWRVSVPATARLVAAGEDVAPPLTRALVAGSVATGLSLSALATAAPVLFPVALGSEWTGAATVVAPACLGLLVSGPVSVAAAGYTYALGNSALVLRAAVAHTLAWFAVMLPLLATLDVLAIALGWLVCSLVDACFFAGVLRRAGVAVWSSLWPSLACALVAYGAGTWLVARYDEPSASALVVGAAVPPLVFLAGILLLRRAALLSTLALTREVFALRRRTKGVSS